MTNTLIEGIDDWLNKGGYPLELYVAKTLKDLGFFCSKSLFFSDAESQNAREIDIVASKSADNELKQTLYIKLVIECKKSSNAFVVLCDSSEEKSILEGVLFGNLYTHNRDDMFVAAPFIMAEEKDYSKIFPVPLLNAPCRSGYTLLQAYLKSDSHIYSEVYKLAKAYYFEIQKEVEFRDKITKDERNADRDEILNIFYSHLPVLVIDAPLVEVYLDEAGDTRIEEKEISSIRIRLPWKLSDKDQDPDEGLSIAIVTKNAFSDFVRDTIGFAQEIVNRQKGEGVLSFVPRKAEA
jgi:hypothetical protein